MNENIINEVPEVIETAIENAGRFGFKHVIGGFIAGLGTGIAGTRLAKSVKGWHQDRKAERNEARFHRVKENNEEDDVEVATDN